MPTATPAAEAVITATDKPKPMPKLPADVAAPAEAATTPMASLNGAGQSE